MPDTSQLQIISPSTNGSLWPGSLADRFQKSLAIHSPETARPRSLEALTRGIAENAQKTNERLLDQSFLTIAARALHIQAATSAVQGIVSKCAEVCESPIELALTFAVGFVGRQQCASVLYDFGDDVILGDAEGDTTLRIKPQARVAEFRIDLLLTMQRITEGPDGLNVVTKQLAVETDGAEFHDRTQEQAMRDRKRDRRLQVEGMSVFRFAGGEVWRDVFGCARETVDFLKNEIGRDVKLSQGKPVAREEKGGSHVRAASAG